MYPAGKNMLFGAEKRYQKTPAQRDAIIAALRQVIDKLL